MQQPKYETHQDIYCPEEELNALTNFLLTVHEDQNILDVLQLLVTLAQENPQGVAGCLADSRGTACVFKLLNSSSEQVKIHAVKLLTLIMENSSQNKKKELMEEAGLWALLTDRLSLHSPSLTTALYTALFELMTQSQARVGKSSDLDFSIL